MGAGGGRACSARAARRWPARALAVLLPALLTHCATPGQPTGGPVDTTPPTLVDAVPAPGATRVRDGRVVLTFSERMAATLRPTAVTVTPALATPPEVSVRGREVVVELPAPLRDSTTYVVTVSTEAQDSHGVALRTPATVAFATGDVLDAGRIAGTLRDPQTGAGVGGMQVWAYRLGRTDSLPDPREAWPDVYRTETDASGAFGLGFLREGPYYVVAVQDANRNGRADAGEAFAAPPSATVAAVAAPDPPAGPEGVPGGIPSGVPDSVAARASAPEARPAAPPVPQVTLYRTRVDSLAPELRGVRAISNRRFIATLSEAVVVPADRAVTVGGVPAELYGVAERPSQVGIWASAAVPGDSVDVRLPAALADSSGNGVAAATRRVAVPSEPDTLATRFVRAEPAATDSVVVLGPGQDARLVLTGPSTRPFRLDLGAGGVRDASASAVRLDVGSAPLRVRLPAGDSVRVVTFRRPLARETGALIGTVAGAGGAPVLVEARRGSDPPVRRPVGADGAFRLDGLLPGEYRLRFLLDADGDGAWSGGRLAPYVPPERLAFASPLQRVRARFDTDVGAIDLSDLEAPGP